MSAQARKRVVFSAPKEVEVREESVGDPGPGEVRVRTTYSAISPGTERLVYQGQVPEGLSADASIEALQGEGLSYPLSYGYACVGTVEALGNGVDTSWQDRRVFSFQPHVSRFLASTESLIPLPAEVESLDAVMIPTVETAVNLLMDGRPMIGETAVVFGQGVVGLVTTALLAQYPLENIFTSDLSASRRQRSKEMGATEVVDPNNHSGTTVSDLVGVEAEEAVEAGTEYQGADLVYELTGNPSVLNKAIRCTGFRGRIVIGSWYGSKRSQIDLGGRFHRSRMQITASQVSTIDPDYRGRWTKERRMGAVLSRLDELKPSRLIASTFPVTEAPAVYKQLVDDDEMLQPILTYGS